MKKEDLKKTAQYKRIVDRSNATWTVPRAWCTRFDITPTDLLILEEIKLATEVLQSHVYSGSRQGLAVVINGSLPTVDKALDKLEEKGFIRKSKNKYQKRTGGERDVITYECLLPFRVQPNDKLIEEILEANKARNAAVSK